MNILSEIGLIIMLFVIIYELSVFGYLPAVIKTTINSLIINIQTLFLTLNNYLKG